MIVNGVQRKVALTMAFKEKVASDIRVLIEQGHNTFGKLRKNYHSMKTMKLNLHYGMQRLMQYSLQNL